LARAAYPQYVNDSTNIGGKRYWF